MKIHKVSIQRLKEIVEAYERDKDAPFYLRTYKISERNIFIEVGEKQ